MGFAIGAPFTVGRAGASNGGIFEQNLCNSGCYRQTHKNRLDLLPKLSSI